MSMNQGAESTLAFLLSLSELRLLEQQNPPPEQPAAAGQEPCRTTALEKHRREEFVEVGHR